MELLDRFGSTAGMRVYYALKQFDHFFCCPDYRRAHWFGQSRFYLFKLIGHLARNYGDFDTALILNPF